MPAVIEVKIVFINPLVQVGAEREGKLSSVGFVNLRAPRNDIIGL
jgi:hypothetical protein